MYCIDVDNHQDAVDGPRKSASLHNADCSYTNCHLQLTPSFFYKQLLYKQQGFKNLQIKQSEGFKI